MPLHVVILLLLIDAVGHLIVHVRGWLGRLGVLLLWVQVVLPDVLEVLIGQQAITVTIDVVEHLLQLGIVEPDG